MKNSVIIIAIIVIVALVAIGAYAAMNMFQVTADNMNTITANGSKVTVINNNKDVWAHWKLQIQNAPQKNGTQQTYFVDLYIKPGENATFDLSNMLSYGSTPLPQDTNITVLGWGGVYNPQAGGESKFTTTFLGWTTNQMIPSPTEIYKSATNAFNVDPLQPIGALPANINGTTVTISISDPGTQTNDQLFLQFNIIIGPGGVPYFNPRGIPTLCSVIGQV